MPLNVGLQAKCCYEKADSMYVHCVCHRVVCHSCEWYWYKQELAM